MNEPGRIEESFELVQHLLFAVKSRDAYVRRSPHDCWTSFIAHVLETVPRYASLDRLAHSSNPREALLRFPVTERREIVKDYACHLSSSFLLDDHFEVSTSGTTGVPLKVRRDRISQYSATYGTFELVFQRIPILRGLPKPNSLAVLVVNDNPEQTDQRLLHPGLSFAKVRRLIIGRGELADRNSLAALDECPILLTGRPRALMHLAELSPEMRPVAILTSGDNLHEDSRCALNSTFQAPVYNAYASQEAGMVALECDRHSGLHVIQERAVFEVLADGKYEPDEFGSGEMVVTSNDNWAMPVVRYRTGDNGTIEHRYCDCGISGPMIVSLSGRDSVHFTIAGARFNPSIFNRVFEDGCIQQFQMIQNADESFVVKLVQSSRASEPKATVAERICRGVSARIEGVRIAVEWCNNLGAQKCKIQRYVSNARRGEDNLFTSAGTDESAE